MSVIVNGKEVKKTLVIGQATVYAEPPVIRWKYTKYVHFLVKFGDAKLNKEGMYDTDNTNPDFTVRLQSN